MIKDHLEKEYATMKEMCRHYGVVVATFQNRRSKGWPLKDCLLGGQKKMAGVLRKAEMNIAAMTFRLRASWVRSLMEETREIR